MPPPDVLQAMAQAPKEPDPMTLAAKAQLEKVKADSSKAIGEQDLKNTAQNQQAAIQEATLAQRSDYENKRLDLERQKIALNHEYDMGKLQVDREKAIAQANKPSAS
jgi:hypothetical protein